jgi:hypothetical protein
MKKGEAEAAWPTLIDKWVEETKQPWPPNSQFHYSYGSFWSWLEKSYWSYTQFRAVPNARYVGEMWFDKITRQQWHN